MCRAPGNTCLSALGQVRSFGEPARNDSKGCGTIMRVAPIGLGVRRKEVRELAVATSALTHGHPTGQMAAAAWAELLADVAAGEKLEERAYALALSYARLDGGDETATAIRAALAAQRDGRPETVESLGGGWVAEEALAVALYAALTAQDFEDGLRIAVTHTGDSDSTGAVAGNLLGMIYPDQVLSHRWAWQIECADLINRLARDLAVAPNWTEDQAQERSTTYPGY